MFHSRKLNDRIKRLQERTLWIVYRDYKCTFCEILAKDNSLTIYHSNLQKLATGIFNVKVGTELVIMSNVFDIVDCSCNLRNKTKFISKKIHTTKYGTETVPLIGPKNGTFCQTNTKFQPT